jgi:hypothetical protein
VWCGTCYIQMKADKYSVKELVTEDGDMVLPEWQNRHMCVPARNGDNLMCPLQ